MKETSGHPRRKDTGPHPRRKQTTYLAILAESTRDRILAVSRRYKLNSHVRNTSPSASSTSHLYEQQQAAHKNVAGPYVHSLIIARDLHLTRHCKFSATPSSPPTSAPHQILSHAQKLHQLSFLAVSPTSSLTSCLLVRRGGDHSVRSGPRGSPSVALQLAVPGHSVVLRRHLLSHVIRCTPHPTPLGARGDFRRILTTHFPSRNLVIWAEK